jgi:hypothetical protein
MADDAASILFPNDVPNKPSPAPEYFAAARAGAELRLMGHHGDGADRGAGDADRPAGEQKPDAADVLFKDDAAGKGVDYERVVGGELDQVRMDAMKDGDTERADALKAATTALTEDFGQHGSNPADIAEAFQIVRQSAGLTDMTPEQAEKSYADGLAAVQQASISDADLSAARRFIADLEIVSPGVVASLERHGAGNDPRLIRSAIREAKRRGYGTGR